MSEYRMDVVETGLGAFAWQVVRGENEVLARSRSYPSDEIAAEEMNRVVEDLGWGEAED